MNISSENILVTGADGFIGSHLTEALIRSGHKVKAFVQYNSFHSWGWLDDAPYDIRDEVEVIAGDIRDDQFVKDGMKGCDAVFHLAALISIPYSYRSPESYIDTNVKGTFNILQAAREHQIKRLIHTSTSEVYGTAQFVPIHEGHPLHPQSPYAASKAGADLMALSYYHTFQVPVSIVRPFNTYGPRQSARAVIPAIITQIASGKGEIQLGDLLPTRDFSYVSDTVSGFMTVSRSEKTIGEVINIGSNYEVSIGDTARLIAELMNADVTIVQDPARTRPAASEVQRLWADNAKAKQLCGWTPAYGEMDGLQRGLAETIAWFSNPDNLQRYKQGLYQV
ncbi:NAD-dependent 4,6-dehydratase LegB [Paenibacillus rigui]|uniref:NAD-dependent dehydratase n=1 Tax=Paenibacillus rigui TaxID=554312 RepID=A0A229UIH4_9BACL|nr:NAD-dependent 4,6-dehydratase LegB [Paenibacillus rigui]OXM83085.1 NAD-dependent dehydratase [Paenibacillus rigui]